MSKLEHAVVARPDRGCGSSLIGVFSTGVTPGGFGWTLTAGSSLLAKERVAARTRE
jgi:hypothetical protein